MPNGVSSGRAGLPIARNAPSAAIPKRLGFVLATTLIEPPAHPDEEPVQLQVWTLPLTAR